MTFWVLTFLNLKDSQLVVSIYSCSACHTKQKIISDLAQGLVRLETKIIHLWYSQYLKHCWQMAVMGTFSMWMEADYWERFSLCRLTDMERMTGCRQAVDSHLLIHQHCCYVLNLSTCFAQIFDKWTSLIHNLCTLNPHCVLKMGWVLKLL